MEVLPAVPSRLLGKRADNKKKPKYQNFYNRLGGGDLADFRDTIVPKRALEDDKARGQLRQGEANQGGKGHHPN
ncbi:hypothetical protein PR002_g3591 [Phytophthora rubi]|uniref:Uncharacterized protein n=1 Tax=Phytophthora rubi TaxID=129364 RepID=A0A6A3NP75_9STRA|nr:hypothetical protein PR002_g3591 [Phytophthora rubi]